MTDKPPISKGLQKVFESAGISDPDAQQEVIDRAREMRASKLKQKIERIENTATDDNRESFQKRQEEAETKLNNIGEWEPTGGHLRKAILEAQNAQEAAQPQIITQALKAPTSEPTALNEATDTYSKENPAKALLNTRSPSAALQLMKTLPLSGSPEEQESSHTYFDYTQTLNEIQGEKEYITKETTETRTITKEPGRPDSRCPSSCGSSREVTTTTTEHIEQPWDFRQPHQETQNGEANIACVSQASVAGLTFIQGAENYTIMPFGLLNTENQARASTKNMDNREAYNAAAESYNHGNGNAGELEKCMNEYNENGGKNFDFNFSWESAGNKQPNGAGTAQSGRER